MSFNPNAPKTSMKPSKRSASTPSTAQMLAWALAPTTLAAQSAMVRHIGGAQAAGFRPSLVSLLFNAKSFRAAPWQVKVGTGALIAASTAVGKATGVGPRELVEYGKEHFCKPLDNFWKGYPPGGPDGDGGGVGV